MSKAAELAALISSQTALSNRNLIINGAMQIFQRATSATNPGGGYDTVDRFRSSQNNSGLGNYNAEQSTDAPAGFATSYKLTKSGVTSQGASNSAFLQQYFEGQNVQQLQYGSSGAKKVTLSFYVKSSLTGTWGVCLQDGEAGKHNVQTYTINSANTWEYKTVTFDGDTAASIANDNTAELDVQFILGAGSNYQTATTGSWQSGDKKSTSSQTQWPETDGATFFLTGVQLEVGEQATPFEHRSYGEELALCQRYYYQTTYSTGDVTLFVGVAASSTLAAQCYRKHPVTMRSQPTMALNGSITAYDGDSNTSVSGINTNASSTTDGTGNFATTSLAAGRGVSILANNAADFISFDSEL